VPDIPLNASEILAYLNEVAGALPPTGPRHTIVVVGGSLLALHGLRQSTLDVDTLARIEAESSQTRWRRWRGCTTWHRPG
jgi:hypothetical protein